MTGASPEPPVGEPRERGFRLDGVTFAAGGRILLRPTSLVLEPRRFHALVGHNGSGKSTLLKILARQQPPSAGAVLFEGRPLEAWPGRELARRIAYLPQATAAGQDLTVRELVAFGRYPWHGPFGRLAEEDRRSTEAAIGLGGLGGLADRLVDTLSGGERQRAWIAMLAAQEADYVLLDEPISALDLAQQIEVLGLLRRLTRERGTAVLAVLHDINMAARFADEILALRGGSLMARAAPAELMSAARLEEIFGLPMSVIADAGSGRPVAHPR